MTDGTFTTRYKKPVERLSRALITRTLVLIAVCGIAAFAVLAVKLYQVQIVEHDHYESLALGNQLRKSTITASRGTIYDTDGKILAMSAYVENVFISPYEIEQNRENVGLIADGLSAILGVGREMVLEKAAKTSSQYQIIKLKVESGEAGEVREFIKENNLKGIHLEPASKRYYPNNSLACQIIGFVGTENKGLEGLEERYDKYLTGVNGRDVRLKNARGAALPFTDYEDHYNAQDGNSITLTIDSQIQYYVEKHLSQAIEDYDVQNGATCIIMNAKTGAILADASYPNYDPNNFLAPSEKELEKLGAIKDEDEYKNALNNALFRQWRNKSLADTYEPGSVFKIITLSMALEENVASDDSHFDCKGSMEVPGRETPLNCWNIYGHGWQNLNEAIQHSCNMAVVNLALRVGARTFYKYIDAFGLFDKTGIDSNAESSSIWWDKNVFFDKNNQSQLASAAFGQTFKVTPIQMITAVAAAVNGGYLMQPYIVKQITDSDGNMVEANEPTVLRQAISSGTSAAVRAVLEDVVKTGTGKNAQVRGYRVGGKTGTSENIETLTDLDGPKDYIVSFVGFAPADDPEIVILLLMDTPSHRTGLNISGGGMAAPVVGNMLADILPTCLGIKPQYTEEDLKDINIDMPRLTSKSVEEAKEFLAGHGFEYKVVGDGESVTGQLPAANQNVASGTTVTLFAGEDAPRSPVTAPLLSGMTYTEAKQALESRGMFIRTVGVLKSDKKAEVSVQSIQAGTETAYGTVVEVTLIDKNSIELYRH
ncbi:MAG: PASTA domain-containing protein [Oscillospiraceae bacterium]|jgi:stage V sporulation protein D (sporulation-specific penicillin-binding protein)|nr:PASTA domain-containing protein [Oscillospiraceae bacterium]